MINFGAIRVFSLLILNQSSILKMISNPSVGHVKTMNFVVIKVTPEILYQSVHRSLV